MFKKIFKKLFWKRKDVNRQFLKELEDKTKEYIDFSQKCFVILGNKSSGGIEILRSKKIENDAEIMSMIAPLFNNMHKTDKDMKVEMKFIENFKLKKTGIALFVNDIPFYVFYSPETLKKFGEVCLITAEKLDNESAGKDNGMPSHLSHMVT